MDMLIIFFVAVVLVFWGIKKYNDAETNDYAKLLQSNSDMKTKIADVEKSNKELNDRMSEMTSTLMTYKSIIEQGTATISAYEAKLRESDKDIDNVHTQNAKLQKDIARLNDRSFPRTVEFTMKHSGPIQIEIVKAPGASAPSGTPKAGQGSTATTPPKTEPTKKALGKGLNAILPSQPPSH